MTHAVMASSKALPETDTIHYPESDGQPMGETGIHVDTLVTLLGILNTYFYPRPDVYVTGNVFMYYQEGDPSQVVAPDLFVVFNTTKEPRRTWKVWVEGKAPDVIVEITSANTKGQDLWFKRGLYESLGVGEYFLFDPLSEYLDPPLQGYRLVEGAYTHLQAVTSPQGDLRLESELLGLALQVEGTHLRPYDLKTGEKLLTQHEAEAARRRAEAEVARLRAELEKLREAGGTPNL